MERRDLELRGGVRCSVGERRGSESRERGGRIG